MDRLSEYNRTWKSLNRVYSAYAKKRGISETEFLIIYELYTQGSAAQRGLGASLAMPKQTVSAAVRGLEKKGIVKSDFEEYSRKSKTIKLTELGRSEAKRIIEPVIEAERTALSAIDAEAFSAMIAGYDIIEQKLAALLNSEV